MKILMHLLVFLGCFSMAIAEKREDLPYPYSTIDVLPFDDYICIGIPNEMKQLIRDNHVTNVIEVGSWLGCSARHIASILPQNGKVYAVDHWKGSEEHQQGKSAYYKALPFLYEQFLSNIIHMGLANKIVPVKMASLDAAFYFQDQPDANKIDLIYIDASHDTDSVYADLSAWYPYVEDRGILSGDDWLWSSVAEAVNRFAKERNLKVYVHHNFWFLSKE